MLLSRLGYSVYILRRYRRAFRIVAFGRHFAHYHSTAIYVHFGFLREFTVEHNE